MCADMSPKLAWFSTVVEPIGMGWWAQLYSIVGLGKLVELVDVEVYWLGSHGMYGIVAVAGEGNCLMLPSTVRSGPVAACAWPVVSW